MNNLNESAEKGKTICVGIMTTAIEELIKKHQFDPIFIDNLNDLPENIDKSALIIIDVNDFNNVKSMSKLKLDLPDLSLSVYKGHYSDFDDGISKRKANRKAKKKKKLKNKKL